MDMAVVFARFWGIFSIAFFSALLLNKKLYDILLKEKEKQGFIILTGLITLIIGAFQVSVLNTWEFSYRGVVTFIGWFTLLKSFFRLVKPEKAKSAVAENKLIRKDAFNNVFFILCILLGVYLLWMSFL